MSALASHGTRPSFAEFKHELFADLGREGFLITSDLARKSLGEDVDFQTVLAGNSYFCFITLQLLMPRAAVELRKRAIALSRPRRQDFDGRDIPMFSGDLLELGRRIPIEIRNGLKGPDWQALNNNVKKLSYYLFHIENIEKVEVFSLFHKPSSLLPEQAAILGMYFRLSGRQHIVMAGRIAVDSSSFTGMGCYGSLI